jgi:hypothetical protein
MKILKNNEINEFDILCGHKTEIKLQNKPKNAERLSHFVGLKVGKYTDENYVNISLFAEEIEDIINSHIDDRGIVKAYFFNANMVVCRIYPNKIYIKFLDLWDGEVREINEGWTTIEKLKEALKQAE